MKISSYDNLSVRLLSHTKNPEKLIRRALSLTTGVSVRRKNFLKNVWDMGHESAFEHAVFSFLIMGVSRNTVMQLTRHRLCSFTITSQHYRRQDRAMALFSAATISMHGRELREHMRRSLSLYKKMLRGLPREEARQVLPGAVCSDLVWTVNARELALFLNLRRCGRNTEEMRALADKIMPIASVAFPLMKHMGRLDCDKGKCKQRGWTCARRKVVTT